MKQKILQILWLIAFIGLFWYFFGDEYWDFQRQQNTIKEYSLELEKYKENISFNDREDKKNIDGENTLYYTPYLGLLNQLVEEIDRATSRVYLEMYIFTETRIRDAIVRAHKRWVEVKVLLENNPYNAPNLNDKSYNFLSTAWVNVKWSDPLNYSLNHSKLFIIDQSAYVSTGNFSYSLFKYNRDFLVQIWNSTLFEKLLEIFENDFSHIKKGVIYNELVLSPDYSRATLENLVESAEINIDFYFPYINDESIKEKIFSVAKRWIKVRWIVEEGFYDDEKNAPILEDFRNNGVIIKPLLWTKLHAKSILVDNSILYIWSINFSTFSFDENREIWVILRDKKNIEKFQHIFKSDFSQ